MAIQIQVYEEILNEKRKKWERNMLAVLTINEGMKTFSFGRNEDTRIYVRKIDRYPFILEQQARFEKTEKGYVFIPNTRVIMLREWVFFWINFGVKPVSLKKGERFSIAEGDQFVFSDQTGKKEIVLDVVKIY